MTKAKSETPKEIIEEYHKWLKDLPPNAKRLLKKYQEKILEKRSCSDYEQGKKDFADKLDKEVDGWVGIAGGWYKGWIREFIKKELSK